MQEEIEELKVTIVNLNSEIAEYKQTILLLQENKDTTSLNNVI
jgi:uncharacterized coiled-coil DUF342 family protein